MASQTKCPECTRRGHPCVPTSLESLNRAHLQLKADLEMAMTERVEQAERLATLDAKIRRLFKTLQRNEARAIAKVRCVAAELGDDVDGVTDEEEDEEGDLADGARS